MKNEARKRFSCEDVEKIKATVASVEKDSSGEVLPVVRSFSDRYRLPLLRWTAVCQIVFVVAWGVWALRQPMIGKSDLLIFLAVYAVLTLFLLILPQLCPPFLRLLAGKQRMDEAVTDGAVQAFVRYGVTETAERSGILIYISLFERQVVIMADKGIHKKVDPDTWNAVSARIALGMKEGRPTEAIIEAIESCRSLLITHFPPSAENLNELPDFIME